MSLSSDTLEKPKNVNIQTSVPNDAKQNTATVGLAKFHLNLEDKIALYNIYMPYIKNGGVFIATNTSNVSYKLQQKVFVRLSIAHIQVEFIGSIVWINPSTLSERMAGIGVEFSDDLETQNVKKSIEQFLGQALHSNRATHIL